MPQLSRDGDVRVLSLGSDENRFSPEWLDAIEDALAEIEAVDGPCALVTTAEGKFWSNGLDLEWVMAHADQLEAYARRVQQLLARLLQLPVPTVAAIQGHCFAAGAMLALAHDWRYMRADRGFFCLPEVDISIPFTTGMGALIQSVLSPATALEAMTTAHRYGGSAAEVAGIVTAAAAEVDVLPVAVDRAAALAHKAGPTLGVIKARFHGRTIAELREGPVT